MQISNFDIVRVGSNFPQCIDVQKLQPHEENGVLAIAYAYQEKYERKIQLRSNGEFEFALFNFQFNDDCQIPARWKDSKLIWEKIIPASGK